MAKIFGVDVGGTGIKGALVDSKKGALVTKRIRIETPQPATPDAVFATIMDVIGDETWDGPLGVAIPAVVTDGVALTAANIDKSWVGVDAAGSLAALSKRQVVVLNDADAAGYAEITFGAGRGVSGVVIALTFGTGVGSGMFVDGVLVPNTELGHMEHNGDIAELSTAARLVEDDELNLKNWAKEVNRYLRRVNRVFSPKLIIVGGGISKKFEKFSKWFDVGCDVVPAHLRNEAGIVGAAAYAHSQTTKGNP